LNLILLDASEVDSDGRASLDGRRARHLVTVLRVKPGDTVRAGILDGPIGVARVDQVNTATVCLRCAFEGTPSRPAVDLLLALPRPKVLRRLWAQLAALGVGHVILTNAERVERNYFDTHLLDPGVYGPLLIEGLEQARDTRVPRVSIHRRFRVLVEDDLDRLASGSRRIVADPSESTSIASRVRGPGERVLLAVGPEGGWNPFELELLASHGFERAGIGPRPLRSDTACIALVALVHDALRRWA
jgi:16S rRNA (uracil1498-N3)-methyltransferase